MLSLLLSNWISLFASISFLPFISCFLVFIPADANDYY